jgi:hypothetical protein
VRSSKKFNAHLCQKMPFVLTCFQASAAPRPENSDSDEKDALFGLGTQITIVLPRLYDFFENFFANLARIADHSKLEYFAEQF